MPGTDLTVHDDTTASRFTLHLDGRTIAFASYTIEGDQLTVHHVETNPADRGNGYAAVLMDAVLESAHANGQKIRPLCSYAARHIRRRRSADEPAVV